MSRAEHLPGPFRDLLTAIRDALDMPLPSTDDADQREFHRLLQVRHSAVYSTVTVLLRREAPFNPDGTEYIRRRIAETPITYASWQDAAGGGEQA